MDLLTLPKKANVVITDELVVVMFASHNLVVAVRVVCVQGKVTPSSVRPNVGTGEPLTLLV